MGIVNELQESAEKDDVLTVLRKARRVASKLGRKDIIEWIDHEENGYPDKSTVPAYRLNKTIAYFKINTEIQIARGKTISGNGVLPGLDPIVTTLQDPIGEIMSWIDSLNRNPTGGIVITVNQENQRKLRNALSPSIAVALNHITLMSKLDEFQLRNIPEQIKNKILDWALKLEEAGIHGEDQKFSNNDKDAARHIIINIHDQSTKITGNNIQGALQVASPHATQTTSLKKTKKKAT